MKNVFKLFMVIALVGISTGFSQSRDSGDNSMDSDVNIVQVDLNGVTSGVFLTEYEVETDGGIVIARGEMVGVCQYLTFSDVIALSNEDKFILLESTKPANEQYQGRTARDGLSYVEDRYVKNDLQMINLNRRARDGIRTN